MAEWSIALPWKGSNWATGSGVRIPVSPPSTKQSQVDGSESLLILNKVS